MLELMLALLIAAFLIAGLHIAQEYERAIVLRLGRFSSIEGPGLYWIIPFIDAQTTIDVRTRTVNLEQQETITKDSVTIKVNAVLWYRVRDTARAVLQVANYDLAVYQFAVTSLRNVIGQHMLDEVLKERAKLNEQMKRIVDEATETWGIDIEMVEMKDVEIPESLQRAMAREAEAVREKRARLIKAEAEFEASEKLSQSARQISENPIALELRRMQMLSEIGVENNTTTIVMMPAEFMGLARSASAFMARDGRQQG